MNKKNKILLLNITVLSLILLFSCEESTLLEWKIIGSTKKLKVVALENNAAINGSVESVILYKSEEDMLNNVNRIKSTSEYELQYDGPIMRVFNLDSIETNPVFMKVYVRGISFWESGYKNYLFPIYMSKDVGTTVVKSFEEDLN